MDFFHDPSHGWVKAPIAKLIKLGVAHKITPFSYRRGDHAYLEEDCDAPKLVQAIKNKTGSYPALRDRYANNQSQIRRYRSFSINAFERDESVRNELKGGGEC